MGPDVPAIQRVTTTAVQGPKIPRSPIAALKGEVPQNTTIGPSEDNEEEEGQMAMANLKATIKNCTEVLQAMESGSRMESWAAAKLTLARDYTSTVSDFMQYGQTS